MSALSITIAGAPLYPPQVFGPKSDETPARVGSADLSHALEDKNGTYELHSLPPYLSDRARRSSANSRAHSIAQTSINGEKRDTNSPNVVISNSKVNLPMLPFTSTHSRVPVLTNKQFRRNSMTHFVTLCWCIFVEGWNDGSTGPLLPVFQRDYSVGFSIVALYFVSNCIGFLAASVTNVWLNDRIGFGKIMALGAVIQLVSYIIQAPGPPFLVMVFANALTGFGMSLQNAQSNGFVGSLKQHMTTKIGILHAAYGLGAFTSPFVATYFSGTRRWTFHYLVSAVMAVSNVVALVLVFRFKPLEELLAEAGQGPDEPNTVADSKFRQILGLKTVHILAAFALIYIGIEVTLGGWIVTFIIHERGGGHSAGYISSGFFGGLTFGRIGLMWFNKLIGEHRVIFVYSLVTITLEITIWFVPSIFENAIAVSLIGVVLGPMFPILVSHGTKILPRWLLTVSLGWITGIGMAGSAVLPLLTGLLSSRFGIGALQPLLVSMMCVMLVVWAFVPREMRRVD